jgi:hypothetical protein
LGVAVAGTGVGVGGIGVAVGGIGVGSAAGAPQAASSTIARIRLISGVNVWGFMDLPPLSSCPKRMPNSILDYTPIYHKSAWKSTSFEP